MERKKKSLENVVVEEGAGLRLPKQSNVVGSGGKPMGKASDPVSRAPASYAKSKQDQ